VGRSRAAEYDGYEHQTGMGEQATKGVMDRYFKRMGAGEDFSDCYTADVSEQRSMTGGRGPGPAPYGNIS
jgi:hypothetical protein